MTAALCEAIHGKVSDNASNMAKGWAGFDGGFCADHTIELSVKAFTGADGVTDTFSRAKGIVGYFHRSTAGIQDLTTIQKATSLPLKQPIQDVATRWFSSYGMVDWFREQQQAVQMYDVKHGAEAAKNDAYKANRLQHVRTHGSNWPLHRALMVPCSSHRPVYDSRTHDSSWPLQVRTGPANWPLHRALTVPM